MSKVKSLANRREQSSRKKGYKLASSNSKRVDARFLPPSETINDNSILSGIYNINSGQKIGQPYIIEVLSRAMGNLKKSNDSAKPKRYATGVSFKKESNTERIDMNLLLQSKNLVEELTPQIQALKQLSLIMEFKENEAMPKDIDATEDSFLKSFIKLTEAEQEKQIDRLREVAFEHMG